MKMMGFAGSGKAVQFAEGLAGALLARETIARSRDCQWRVRRTTRVFWTESSALEFERAGAAVA